MKRVLIIGGSGFIGARLTSRLLELGYDVSIFDRSPSALHASRATRGDVRDASAVCNAAVGVDCIVNLAAERRHDVQPASLHFDINVGGAENVTKAAVAANVQRLIFLSSVAVYGTHQPLADESTPLRPENPYGRSKALAEEVYVQWAAAHKQRSLLTVRSVVVFGEGQRGNIYVLANQIRRKQFLMVGSGQNRKSIAYVGNVVEFIAQHIDGADGQTLVNYADGPDLRTIELVARLAVLLAVPVPSWRVPFAIAVLLGNAFDVLARLTRRSFPISAVRVRAFCAETRISTRTLQSSGFTPPQNLDNALALMVENMLHRQHADDEKAISKRDG
jgi:GlcNAc-P-P-Und epimerase